MKTKPSPLIYQIKVTLKAIRPPVWRRILVPANTSLYELHTILQIVMDWEDYHLHAFTIAGETYGNPADDESDMFETKNEKRFRLEQLGLSEGSKFEYEYDFGDSWDHILEVEKILPREEGLDYPLCIKGKRATPPEDSGGVWGFANMQSIAGDPANPQHDEMNEWLPEDFDPEAFDLDEINETLHQVHGRRTKKAGKVIEPEHDMQVELEKLMDPKRWELLMTRDSDQAAQELELRRDVIAMLEYLRDNKVTGTTSTGSFPLKAVAEIAARMLTSPELESKAGDKVVRFRSEAEVWPVFFLHLLASASGMIEGGAGRRWRLSSNGEEFLAAPVMVQVWSLFSTWWQAIDWVMAFPFSGLESGLPDGFEDAARDELLLLHASIPTPFATFADRLIARTGFNWPAPDQNNARLNLHRAIESMLIKPMADFDAILPIYEAREGAVIPRELVAFRLMPFGRGLLETIR